MSSELDSQLFLSLCSPLTLSYVASLLPLGTNLWVFVRVSVDVHGLTLFQDTTDSPKAISMSHCTSFYYIHRDTGAGPSAGTSSHIQAIQIRSVPTFGSSLPMQSSMNFARAESNQYVLHSELRPILVQAQDVPASTSSGPTETEPVKKKRGRLRKYGPEGHVGLASVPLSASAPLGAQQRTSRGSGKKRGRPPGIGTKQQLA